MSTRPRHFLPQGTPDAGKKHAALSAVDSLRTHEKMAALMPVVLRIAAIHKDCAVMLPTMFERCAVLRFESGQLVLSATNAAIASRLKQQLPKLQEALCQAGWQVSAIRIKVQVPETIVKMAPRGKQPVPPQGVKALASLHDTLSASPRNDALKAALAAMVRRHRVG